MTTRATRAITKEPEGQPFDFVGSGNFCLAATEGKTLGFFFFLLSFSLFFFPVKKPRRGRGVMKPRVAPNFVNKVPWGCFVKGRLREKLFPHHPVKFLLKQLDKELVFHSPSMVHGLDFHDHQLSVARL